MWSTRKLNSKWQDRMLLPPRLEEQVEETGSPELRQWAHMVESGILPRLPWRRGIRRGIRREITEGRKRGSYSPVFSWGLPLVFPSQKQLARQCSNLVHQHTDLSNIKGGTDLSQQANEWHSLLSHFFTPRTPSVIRLSLISERLIFEKISQPSVNEMVYLWRNEDTMGWHNASQGIYFSRHVGFPLHETVI